MKKSSRNRLTDTENKLTVPRLDGELDEKGEVQMVVTKPSQGCKVQHRKYS